MASPISCLSILVIPLLVTSLFYHVSNADQALIQRVCEMSNKNSFCLSALLSDPLSSTATLYMLGIITVDLNLKVFKEADSRIPNLLASLTDSVDRSRLLNCQTNLADAHQKMIAARNAAGGQSYKEESSLIMDAFTKIASCSNAYADPPKRQSPISDLTYKIVELSNLSNVIIGMIGAS